MERRQILAVADGRPALLFGGPYSNLEATTAVLAEAMRRLIPPSQVVCTGDLVAYCGSPMDTIDLVRGSGIAVVMGNCEEQLAIGAKDCGCGFPTGGSCDRLSAAWYAFADRCVTTDARRWLGSLPRRIDLRLGAFELAVVHGTPRETSRFVFASTATTTKRGAIVDAGCDGVIAGHCGLPFTQSIGGRLWHNPGVIGLPANDGTPRVWCSVLTSRGDCLDIEHVALAYAHEHAARRIRSQALPQAYGDALLTGRWPSLDVLPAVERRMAGVPLSAGSVTWRRGALLRSSVIEIGEALLWPVDTGRSADQDPVSAGLPESNHAGSELLERACNRAWFGNE